MTLSVEVISCFEVKPRRRRHETTVTDRKAFRLCIHEEDCDKLLNEAVWPDSVTLSLWYYKEPNANANVNTANEHSRANVKLRDHGTVVQSCQVGTSHKVVCRLHTGVR